MRKRITSLENKERNDKEIPLFRPYLYISMYRILLMDSFLNTCAIPWERSSQRTARSVDLRVAGKGLVIIEFVVFVKM